MRGGRFGLCRQREQQASKREGARSQMPHRRESAALTARAPTTIPSRRVSDPTETCSQHVHAFLALVVAASSGLSLSRSLEHHLIHFLKSVGTGEDTHHRATPPLHPPRTLVSSGGLFASSSGVEETRARSASTSTDARRTSRRVGATQQHTTACLPSPPPSSPSSLHLLYLLPSVRHGLTFPLEAIEFSTPATRASGWSWCNQHGYSDRRRGHRGHYSMCFEESRYSHSTNLPPSLNSILPAGSLPASYGPGDRRASSVVDMV